MWCLVLLTMYVIAPATRTSQSALPESQICYHGSRVANLAHVESVAIGRLTELVTDVTEASSENKPTWKNLTPSAIAQEACSSESYDRVISRAR